MKNKAEAPELYYHIVQPTTKMFVDKDYAQVDRLLKEDLRLEWWISLIRTTYPARGKLSNWEDSKDRLAKLLQDQANKINKLGAE